jgi:tetratricopeptide (TPR) repeat protein
VLGDLFAETFPRLAKANYVKADRLRPSNPDVLVGLSACSMNLGFSDEALDYARQAVGAGSDQDASVVTHLARILLTTKEFNEAEQHARAALQSAEDDSRQDPGNRHSVSVLASRLDLLLEILTKHAAQQPQQLDLPMRSADAMERRGQVQALLARFDALARLEMGLQKSGLDAPVHYRLKMAVLMAELGRERDAVESFREILLRDPQNTLARDWLTRLGAEPLPLAKPEGEQP